MDQVTSADIFHVKPTKPSPVWRSFVFGVAAALCVVPGLAQEVKRGGELDLQVHGFATQAVVYTSANNYLGMNTSSGTLGWSEAAVNVENRFSTEFRAGAQLHMTRLGEFGGYTPTVDWALVEYSPKNWLTLRAGKVKIPWGLFNNTQDADVGYLWCLLPESTYGVDIRATNLSQYGAEASGHVSLPGRAGAVSYSAYYGIYSTASKDGYLEYFREQGLDFTHPARGKVSGLDLRYRFPGDFLQVGASLMFYDLRGMLRNGSYYQPIAHWPAVYGRFTHKRLELDAEYNKAVVRQTVTVPGTLPAFSESDTRSWFVMGTYSLTRKLQVGSYYDRYRVAGTDQSDPANYFHDAVLSARYDINPHVYTKLEGHLMHGTGVGLYSVDNVNGLAPAFNALAAKIGYSF